MRGPAGLRRSTLLWGCLGNRKGEGRASRQRALDPDSTAVSLDDALGEGKAEPGALTVSATSRDHQVIFRVADTGSGIAPENLTHVFDRFWQASKAGGLGAGLGLPITKGIVEAHGGRIWVESTPSRGTTFSFTVPQATPDQGRPSGPSGSSLLTGYQAA